VARKDLSRTVIEGGRTRGNKDRRRASHGVARARAREWLDGVRADNASADASAPRRPPRVYKQFDDKLGPAMRWLDAQVGRPWSKVFGELCARFDTRTVAGRHIVHDHMLGAVALDGSHEVRNGQQLDYVVDRRGILRRSRWYRRSYWQMRSELLAWVGERVALKGFRGWWWYRLDHLERCEDWRCARPHVRLHDVRWHELRVAPLAAMTAAELRRVDRLPAQLRADVVLHRSRLANPPK
jgi:hypothetical protein